MDEDPEINDSKVELTPGARDALDLYDAEVVREALACVTNGCWNSPRQSEPEVERKEMEIKASQSKADYEGKFDHWPRFAIILLTCFLLPSAILALFFGWIVLAIKAKLFVKALVGAVFTLLAVLETYFSVAHLLAYRKHGGSAARRRVTFVPWAVFTGISICVLVGSLFVVLSGVVGKVAG